MKGKSIASMVLGIVSLFLCAIPCSIISLVLGSQVLNDPNCDEGSRKRAIAGRITSIIGFVILVIYICIVSIAAGMAASMYM